MAAAAWRRPGAAGAGFTAAAFAFLTWLRPAGAALDACILPSGEGDSGPAGMDCASAPGALPLGDLEPLVAVAAGHRRLHTPEAGNDDEDEVLGPKSRFPMYVGVDWEMFQGVSDAKAIVEGVMHVDFIWPTAAENYTKDAYSVVQVDNFGTGSSGMVAQPVLNTRLYGIDMKVASVRYIGQFKQSFDSTCYPFDQVEVEIHFAIKPPGSYVFDLFPICGHEGTTAYDKEGAELPPSSPGKLRGRASVCEVHNTDGQIASGFKWTSLRCVKEDKVNLVCTMTGVRQYWKLLELFIVPSAAVSIMSFLSFKMRVNLFMPRVATTMIAMLTQINLKSNLSQRLPVTGKTSWMEFYFLMAIAFMLTNLVGHVFSFNMFDRNKSTAVAFVDEVFFEIAFCVAIICPLVKILSSGCTQHVNVPVVYCILSIFVVVLVYQMVTDLNKYKEYLWKVHLKYLWRPATERVSDAAKAAQTMENTAATAAQTVENTAASAAQSIEGTLLVLTPSALTPSALTPSGETARATEEATDAANGTVVVPVAPPSAAGEKAEEVGEIRHV
eukprot:TRINITY_DN864_c0_g1_i1.p1 TRINITY_DN864_c0_g1~~TRINITY_DN864_c0_g1_i1.p1  ORF type:complete len:555 (+),score=108.85 TRINITY_DN864_c0_g1_i1:94-1758(+)